MPDKLFDTKARFYHRSQRAVTKQQMPKVQHQSSNPWDQNDSSQAKVILHSSICSENKQRTKNNQHSQKDSAKSQSKSL